jgi:hypothetical protein
MGGIDILFMLLLLQASGDRHTLPAACPSPVVTVVEAHSGSFSSQRSRRVGLERCETPDLVASDDSVASKAIRDRVSSRSRAISAQSSITGWLAIAETERR